MSSAFPSQQWDLWKIGSSSRSSRGNGVGRIHQDAFSELRRQGPSPTRAGPWTAQEALARREDLQRWELTPGRWKVDSGDRTWNNSCLWASKLWWPDRGDALGERGHTTDFGREQTDQRGTVIHTSHLTRGHAAVHMLEGLTTAVPGSNSTPRGFPLDPGAPHR